MKLRELATITLVLLLPMGLVCGCGENDSGVPAKTRWTLAVGSFPDADCIVSVSEGTQAKLYSTPFEIEVDRGVAIRLAAHSECGGKAFQRWTENGVAISSDTLVVLAMDRNRELMAEFAEPMYLNLVTNSDQATSITLDPPDIYGNTRVTTPAQLAFREGTIVVLTAANSINIEGVNAEFLRWCPGASTNRSMEILMDQDRTMTAVYPVRLTARFSDIPYYCPPVRLCCCLPITVNDDGWYNGGPRVWYTLNLSQSAGSIIRARLIIDSQSANAETPKTACRITHDWTAILPAGYSLYRILGTSNAQCGRDPLYTDNNTRIDCFNSSALACPYISQLCFMGDTYGQDLNYCNDPNPCLCEETSYAGIYWNDIPYLAIPPLEPCQ